MTIVKTLACLAAILCPVMLLAGCGGGDDPRTTVTPRYVPVTLVLNWNALPAGAVVPVSTPTRAVAVPTSAFSVRIRLTNLSVSPATENDLVTVATINRSTTNRAAYRQNFTTPTVVARPNVSTYVEVQCFSGVDGGGALIASQKRLLQPLPASGDLGDFNLAGVAP